MLLPETVVFKWFLVVLLEYSGVLVSVESSRKSCFVGTRVMCAANAATNASTKICIRSMKHYRQDQVAFISRNLLFATEEGTDVFGHLEIRQRNVSQQASYRRSLRWSEGAVRYSHTLLWGSLERVGFHILQGPHEPTNRSRSLVLKSQVDRSGIYIPGYFATKMEEYG